MPAAPKLARAAVFLEQPVREVFRLLHVRLIERVDAEHRAGRRRRDLPHRELFADVETVGHPQAHDRVAGGLEQRQTRLDRAAVHVARDVAVGKPFADVDEDAIVAVVVRRAERFALDRNDAGAVLAGALRDQLFRPGPERFDQRVA